MRVNTHRSTPRNAASVRGRGCDAALVARHTSSRFPPAHGTQTSPAHGEQLRHPAASRNHPLSNVPPPQVDGEGHSARHSSRLSHAGVPPALSLALIISYVCLRLLFRRSHLPLTTATVDCGLSMQGGVRAVSTGYLRPTGTFTVSAPPWFDVLARTLTARSDDPSSHGLRSAREDKRPMATVGCCVVSYVSRTARAMHTQCVSLNVVLNVCWGAGDNTQRPARSGGRRRAWRASSCVAAAADPATPTPRRNPAR
jgi:hypothetical protein